MNASSTVRTAVTHTAVFGLFAALTSSVGQTYFIGLFGIFFREDYALSASQLGALYGAATLISGALMFWLGAIVDRFALHRVVPFAAALLVLGCLLMTTSSSAVSLAFAFVLLRFGGQGMMSHLAIVAAARSAIERRGRNLAVAASGYILGEAIFPASVAAMLVYLTWRSVWLSASLAILLLALPGLWWISKRLPHDVPSVTHKTDTGSLSRLDLLRTPQFLAALSIVLVSSFVVTAVFFHLSALGQLRSWSAAEIASGFVVFAGAQFSAIAGAGKLVDRFGAARLLRFHLLPAAVSLLVLGLIHSPAAVWIVFAGLGASAGANSVISGALWPELFGVQQIGMVRGVYAAFTVAASAVSPFLLGQVLSDAVALSVSSIVCALYCVIVPAILGAAIRHRIVQTQ